MASPIKKYAVTSMAEVTGMELDGASVVSAPNSGMFSCSDRILEVDNKKLGKGHSFLQILDAILSSGMPALVTFKENGHQAKTAGAPFSNAAKAANGTSSNAFAPRSSGGGGLTATETTGAVSEDSRVPGAAGRFPSKISNDIMPSLVAVAETIDISAVPITNILYMRSLAETMTFEHSNGGTIVKVYPLDNKHIGVILSETIFHAQGGGQPADMGEIRVLAQSLILNVDMVVDRNHKVFVHVAPLPDGLPMSQIGSLEGQAVSQHIEPQLRVMAAKFHSGGHVLDAAVKQSGHADWKAMKGHHFPDGPYVEYKVTEADKAILKTETGKADVITQIQTAAQQIIDHGKISMRYIDSVRHVTVAGLEMPCGGTHVDDLTNLGKFIISKVTPKRDRVKVSYHVV